jgi:hypothetical protein
MSDLDLVDELELKIDLLNTLLWDLNANAETAEREARRTRALADAVKEALEGTERKKEIVLRNRRDKVVR